MNVIELESNGYKMECALFGSYVDELNTILGSGDVVHPVFIVQLAKVKSFKGKISLQNVIICTKIIFNPTCAKAIEFRQNMIRINNSPFQTLNQLQDSSRVSAEEDFLFMIPRKNIMELNDTKEGEERYRIKVRVIDETDSATFVIFDRDATSAIKKSCADLIKSVDKAADPFFIPKEISDLVEKTLLFKTDEGVETYLNVVISDDIIGPDLMSKFTNVFDESQAECGDAINLDLTQSPVYKIPTKRSCELEGAASEKASAMVLKNEIKIEKN